MERSRTTSGTHDDKAPLITTPDTSYDNGDVAMQHIDSPRYSPTMIASPEATDRDYSTYRHSSSSTFDVEDGTQYQKQTHGVKHFDHHEARRTLMKNGLWRLLITLFFSAAMCFTLKCWEGWNSHIVLSNKDIRIFNSLTLGLSLCLGLNLLASLKHYASVFRWFFLTRRYVSLEVFDLILHFGSLAKVTKLMIISSPGFRGRKWLRKFSLFKDVRDDGTTWMWLVCVIWLLINIGSQILVALLSLFWPLNNSDNPLLAPGTVAVADLREWYVVNNDTDRDSGWNRPIREISLEAAWSFGNEANSYPEYNLTHVQKDLSSLPGTPIYKGNDSYHYRFYNREPKHPFINYVNSSRNVTARATCEELEVGSDGEVIVEEDTWLYVNASRPGANDYVPYYVLEKVPGSISWMASTEELCGPRCTNFTVLQTKAEKADGADKVDDRVTRTSLFLCNSTLGEVSPITGNDIEIHSKDDAEAVYGSDEFARIAAGAIAWTGITWYTDAQVRSYSQGNKWSPAKLIAKEDVEDLLMRFTIGAVAAFDDHGIRYNLTHQTVVPFPGQQLDVDWSYIFSILGGICGIQFLALCVLHGHVVAAGHREDWQQRD
ncbi:hypothetical protein DDE82_008054 [Stemphylium lycopersici]|nr:hypothetical protein DDE82_008054 [Stemphylium lycopersici]